MNFEYFQKIQQILSVVEDKEVENINQAVQALVAAIEHKKIIYTFGASHAGILSEELYYRAGGLMLMNPIFAKELMLDNSPITQTSRMEQLVGYGNVIAEKVVFQDGDVLIVHSVSGRNPVSVELAQCAKKKNVNVIALTNLSYSKSVTSRAKSGKRLFECADIVIDNHGDIGDACIQIEGIEQKVSPTSTVVGATILNTIVSEVVKKLKKNGMQYPPIFYSANLDGGAKLNLELVEKYKEQMKYIY